MKEFWNERYGSPDYVYGKEPNEYLKEKLGSLQVGKILFPAEGEGRNAVFAAGLGWQVTAFDISEEGKNKAHKLAAEKKVQIDYHVLELHKNTFSPEEFDAIALIYAHLSPQVKEEYFRYLVSFLKVGGYLIFEGFSREHLEYQKKDPGVGGPKDLETLFSREELKRAFKDFEFSEFFETEILLNEGRFHRGTGAVIRFMARKLPPII